MNASQLFRFITGIALATLLGAAAQASFIPTVQGYWRLGEDDPGATAPNTVNTTTVDHQGNLNLTRQNGTSSINYSTDAAPKSPLPSTLSVNFNVNPYYSANSVVSSATDNFGYEIWIKPASGQNGDRNIFGDQSIALIVNANEFRGIYQGHTVFDPIPNTSVSSYYGTWVDLALVRDNGTLKFFLNGTQLALNNSGPELTQTPNTPSQPTYISQANGTSVQRLDEARIFTFTGAFDPSYLYFNQTDAIPEPSTILLFSLGAGLVYRRLRRR